MPTPPRCSAVKILDNIAYQITGSTPKQEWDPRPNPYPSGAYQGVDPLYDRWNVRIKLFEPKPTSEAFAISSCDTRNPLLLSGWISVR